jgi:hypothetical protein
LIVRLVASVVAAIATAVLTVLVLTIVDLYLTGHGYASINRAVAWSMSPSDMILIAAVLAASLGTWFALRRSRP